MHYSNNRQQFVTIQISNALKQLLIQYKYMYTTLHNNVDK